MAILTITGPTAAGKSTIERELRQLGCANAISHTTRLPRAGEQSGIHYHFVTDFEYDRLKSEGEFVEAITFGTRRYAMSKTALRLAVTQAENVVIVVDPHGASQIRWFAQGQGIPVQSIWIDCAPVEQSRRWVARLASDLIIGKEAVGAYAERLGLMLTEEAIWRRDAAAGCIEAGGAKYDIQIRSDGDSPLKLAKFILRNSLSHPRTT